MKCEGGEQEEDENEGVKNIKNKKKRCIQLKRRRWTRRIGVPESDICMEYCVACRIFILRNPILPPPLLLDGGQKRLDIISTKNNSTCDVLNEMLNRRLLIDLQE